MQLGAAINEDISDDFRPEVAKNVEDARELIELGFEYVHEIDGFIYSGRESRDKVRFNKRRARGSNLPNTLKPHGEKIGARHLSIVLFIPHENSETGIRDG